MLGMVQSSHFETAVANRERTNRSNLLYLSVSNFECVAQFICHNSHGIAFIYYFHTFPVISVEKLHLVLINEYLPRTSQAKLCYFFHFSLQQLHSTRTCNSWRHNCLFSIDTVA